MSTENVNFRYPSCPSLNSFQSLQKIRELFFKQPTLPPPSVNYDSLEKLLADSKFTIHDEPINSEFFTYFTAKSNSDFKKPNATKPSDTQSKIIEFLKNCIIPTHLFGSCQDPNTTSNKACMCKPVRKDSKSDLEPKHGKQDKSTPGGKDDYITNNLDNSGEPLKRHTEDDLPKKPKRKKGSSLMNESEQFGLESLEGVEKNGKERHPAKKSKKRKESSTLTDNTDTKTNIPMKHQPESAEGLDKEHQTSSDSIVPSPKAKTNPQSTTIPVEMQTNQTPKIVLHLPVDFTQFGSPSTGNDLKLVLCGNRKEQCNCESCGSDEKLEGNKEHKKKKKVQTDKKKKKNKALETDNRLFVDEETAIDSDNLDPESKAYLKEEKSNKMKWLNCFKGFNKKSRSKDNQTDYSDLDEDEPQQKQTKKQQPQHQNEDVKDKKNKALKDMAKCCRCNKFDPDCPMSGEQIDTLKLLIKMEAKQNYRQINNIIKELNDQQEDIRKLRQTHMRIVQHFPEIFEKENAQGDNNLSNVELKDNVKTLFGMYKELSVKINEIHRLSTDIIRNNSEVMNVKHSQQRPLSNKTLSVKPPVKDFSESSTASKSDENNSREMSKSTGVSVANTEQISKSGGVFVPNAGDTSKSTGVSGIENLYYVDEIPEKLPKSETASAKKQTCPCEINSGLYNNNNVKVS